MIRRILLVLGFFFGFSLAVYAQDAMDCNQQGLDLYRQGHFSEAVEAYEQALKLNPHYPIALNNLGIARYHLGAYAEAERCFKGAIALNPDYVQPVVNLGLVYFRTGRYFDALSQYWKAKSLDPYYTKMRVSKRKAEDLLNEELERHPNDPKLIEIKQKMKGLERLQ